MELREALKILHNFGIYAEEFSVSDTEIKANKGATSVPNTVLDGKNAVALQLLYATNPQWQVMVENISRITYVSDYHINNINKDWVKDIEEAVNSGNKTFVGNNRKSTLEEKNKYVMSILNEMTSKESLGKLNSNTILKKYSTIIAPKK